MLWEFDRYFAQLNLKELHTDQHFIEGLRRNDGKSIQEIYAKFSNAAINWVRNNNGTTDDARDVFQEAVIALYEKAQDPAFTLTCPLGAMLYLIYSRKWIDRLRAKKKEQEVRIAEESRYKDEISPDLLDLAAALESENIRHKKLAIAFNQLSDLCKQLIQLLGEGITPAAAAEELQFNSVDTLYRRKNACISRWKEVYTSLQ